MDRLRLMMMMNCFCGMADRRKAFSRISSRDHCQRSSPSRSFDTPRAEFEPAQNLSSGLVEWSCAVAITTTPRRYKLRHKYLKYPSRENFVNMKKIKNKYDSIHRKSKIKYLKRITEKGNSSSKRFWNFVKPF